MAMPLNGLLVALSVVAFCVLFVGYGKVPQIALLSRSSGDVALTRQLDEDDKLLAGLDSRFDPSQQASAKKARYMISKFGKVPASWCAPDSPRCEDMAGKRVLGQGQENLGNGLLNLAAKDPDLFEKAMRRNGGSFEQARKSARPEKSDEQKGQVKEEMPQVSGLDRLKDAFPDLYAKAIARNGGRMQPDHSDAAANKQSNGHGVTQEEKARLSSLAQVPSDQDPLLDSLESELEEQKALTKQAEDRKKSAEAQMKQVRSSEALTIEQAALRKEQRALVDAKHFLADAKETRKESEKQRDSLKKAAEIRQKVEELKERRRKAADESKQILKAKNLATSSLESSLKSMTIHQAIANLLADSTFDSRALHVAQSLQKMEEEKSQMDKEAARNRQLTDMYLQEAASLKSREKASPHPHKLLVKKPDQDAGNVLEQEKLQVKKAASRVRKSHRRMLRAKRLQEEGAENVQHPAAHEAKTKSHPLVAHPVVSVAKKVVEVKQPPRVSGTGVPPAAAHHAHKTAVKTHPHHLHHPAPTGSAADLRSSLTGFEKEIKSAIASEVDKTVEPLKHEIEEMKTSLEVERGESQGYKSALSAVLKDTVGAIVRKAIHPGMKPNEVSSTSSTSISRQTPALSDRPPLPQHQGVRFAEDDRVRYEDAAAHDKATSGITYHDRFARLEPESEENMRTMYGSEWKYTNPDVPYRYGRRQEDASGQLTSVPASAMANGQAPKDFLGTVDESEFSQANRGRLGDHLVGGDDKMVPQVFSNKELSRSTYTGSVEHNMKMEKQDDDHGLIGDRFWALPAGRDNKHLVYGKLEDYSGDKKLGFGDQLVPLPEAIKQQWGGGHWKGMHTQHLADFLVSVNPTGNPQAFGTHPFHVRSVEDGGDGKTED